jgi:hypothetical protein
MVNLLSKSTAVPPYQALSSLRATGYGCYKKNARARL